MPTSWEIGDERCGKIRIETRCERQPKQRGKRRERGVRHSTIPFHRYLRSYNKTPVTT
ncbi:hypothetical protein RSAG8_10754, partial [Rhizoctonia solani AG-8 WAC10335]